MMAKETDGSVCEMCGFPTWVFSRVEDSAGTGWLVCDVCRSESRWAAIEDEDYVSIDFPFLEEIRAAEGLPQL